MVRVDHKFVYRKQRQRRRKKDGSIWSRTYYYYRRPGAPDDGVRLPDDPASPEFAATLQQFNERVENQPAKPAPASLAGLVERYKAAPEFTDLAVKSQKDYGRILGNLTKRYGHLPYAAIDREVVYAIRDSLAATPTWANYTTRVLRLLLGWAVDRGMLASNPASRPKQLRIAPRRQVWSEEAEAAFLALAPAPMALAYTMAAYSAQRQGDILAMTWAQFTNGRLRLRQAKTGALVEVPCHSVLLKALDGAPRVSTHILTSEKGRPFKADHFRHEWRKVTTAAKLDGLQFRDLRRTAMVRLAEAGATEIEVAAVSGHEIEQTRRILETYIPRNSQMAGAAVQKLEDVRKKREREKRKTGKQAAKKLGNSGRK